MISYDFLNLVHDLLLSYVRRSPSASVSRVITEVERELQDLEGAGMISSYTDAVFDPLWRRIKALESQVKELKGRVARR